MVGIGIGMVVSLGGFWIMRGESFLFIEYLIGAAGGSGEWVDDD